MDLASIQAVFEQVDRELWVVTASAGSQRGGLIASFVNPASIVPTAPRMLVGLARQHHTWEVVEASGAFALHLIAEDQLDWVWRFGLQSGRDHDKWEGLPTRPGSTGSPILEGAAAWLDCHVEARLDTGDRTVYLTAVVDAGLMRRVRALTVKRLLQLAPADKVQTLKELMVQDSAVDAAAISAWREQLGR